MGTLIYDQEREEWVNSYFIEIERQAIREGVHIVQEKKWVFDWNRPFAEGFEVYGLITEKEPDIIQGMIALKPNFDPDYRCVDVNLIESAPHNKKMCNRRPNRNRLYLQVGKCLIAFACQYSFECGLDGYVQLTSKSSKIELYKKLGFHHTYGHNMAIETIASARLVAQYFQGGVRWWEK